MGSGSGRLFFDAMVWWTRLAGSEIPACARDGRIVLAMFDKAGRGLPPDQCVCSDSNLSCLPRILCGGPGTGLFIFFPGVAGYVLGIRSPGIAQLVDRMVHHLPVVGEPSRWVCVRDW